MKTLYGYLLILIVVLSINAWVTTGAVLGLVFIAISFGWVKLSKFIFKKPQPKKKAEIVIELPPFTPPLYQPKINK